MLILVAFQALLLLLIVSFTTIAARFPLIHRPDNYSFEARMKRDAMRVASLTRLLAANEAGDDHFSTDLQHIDEYFTEVGVGTPPQTQTLVIDTGSNMLWVQCQPCDPLCYEQFDPVFDPTKSTSFADVGCDDLNCYKVKESNRGCDTSRCTYKYMYGDGTDISGTMAIENITIGDTIVPNIIIGCTHTAQGLLIENQADGILGLGSGALSVMSQSGGLIGGMFSYCLSNSTTGGGWLEFGRTNVSRDNVRWASLINNPKHPSFYYIDLVGLSVAGEVLNISEDVFQINQETGEGGVVLDTGTVVTWLAEVVEVVYVALRDKFREKMVNYDMIDGVSIFDTCYNRGEVDLNKAPTVSFNFLSQGFDPASITLEATNVLYEVDYTENVCLAFAPSLVSLSIIGNMHQQGIQITIDAAAGYVGFGSGLCLLPMDP
ncbi:hypothetical protein CASFOL_039666 [Castilleja foliolosa]|uniref:Peptidase A1 domain-containing protein n=1 Tax=Castilleja foliolosa TaxID=1961234 RepID=A0ABD3BGR9_9LAMI